MKLSITRSARQRLRSSLEFYRGYMTEREAEEVKAALRYIEEHPGRGAYEDLIEVPGRRYRRMVVGDFKIIYYLRRTMIRVTDIFDTRQDPRKMRG